VKLCLKSLHVAKKMLSYFYNFKLLKVFYKKRGIDLGLIKKIIDNIRGKKHKNSKKIIHKDSNFNDSLVINENKKNHYELIKDNDFNKLKQLLDKGVNIDTRDKTPLNYAIIFGRYEIVELLLENGFNINSKIVQKNDQYGLLNSDKLEAVTPLMLAVQEKNPKMVKLLVNKGANLEIRNYNGETAIMHAIKNYAEEDIIEILIDAGANVKIKNIYNKSILELLSEKASYKIKKRLVLAGADATKYSKDKDGFSRDNLLMEAVMHNDNVFLELLLNSNIKLNEKNNQGKTVFEIISENEVDKKISNLLLNAKKEKQVKKRKVLFSNRYEFSQYKIEVSLNSSNNNVKNLETGDILFLLREPEHKEDTNTISVRDNRSNLIGYINKDLSRRLAPVLDRGENYRGVINSVIKNNGNICSFIIILESSDIPFHVNYSEVLVDNYKMNIINNDFNSNHSIIRDEALWNGNFKSKKINHIKKESWSKNLNICNDVYYKNNFIDIQGDILFIKVNKSTLIELGPYGDVDWVDECFLYGINKHNGEKIWGKKCNSLDYPIFIEDIVLINDTNIVKALSIENGNEIWSFSKHSNIFGQPIYYNDKIYFASYNLNTDTLSYGNDDYTKIIYALNLENGKTEWKKEILGFQKENIINFICGNELVYIKNNVGIKALNYETGKTVFEKNFGSNKISSLITFSNGVLYCTSEKVNKKVTAYNHYDKYLNIIDGQNGDIIWMKKISPEYKMTISKNYIYLLEEYDNVCLLYKLNAVNGKIIWLHKIEETNYKNSNKPTISKDNIYVTTNNNLYSIDKYNGDITWEMSINNSGRACVVDDFIYINDNNTIKVVDGKDGREISSYSIDEENLIEIENINSGYIYILGEEKLYSLK